MKKIRKPDMLQSITLASYISIAVLPFVLSYSYQPKILFSNLFLVSPVNLLIYVTPVLLYFAIKKADLSEKEKTANLIITDTLLITLIYSAHTLNIHTTTFALAALLILSFLCINAGDAISMAVLIPGILIIKLGIGFIFACYIPILLLIFLRTEKNEKNPDAKNKTSSFLPFAYLYISVLAAILIASGRFDTATQMPLQQVAGRNETLNIISGVILSVVACTVFLARAIPATKGSSLKTVIAIIYAFYPLGVIIFNLFLPVISHLPFVAVFFALIIYTIGNIQLSLTYKEKAPSALPAKIPFYPFAITTAVLFLFFIAE